MQSTASASQPPTLTPLLLLLLLHDEHVRDLHGVLRDGHHAVVGVAKLVDAVDCVGVQRGEVDNVLKHVQAQGDAVLCEGNVSGLTASVFLNLLAEIFQYFHVACLSLHCTGCMTTHTLDNPKTHHG